MLGKIAALGTLRPATGVGLKGEDDRRPPPRHPTIHSVKMRRASLAIPVSVLAAFLLGASCRSAYGVDPLSEPKKAAQTPGFWEADLYPGEFAGDAHERVRLFNDGRKAGVIAVTSSRGDITKSSQANLTQEEFTSFV